jgi:hypothetical protein
VVSESRDQDVVVVVSNSESETTEASSCLMKRVPGFLTNLSCGLYVREGAGMISVGNCNSRLLVSCVQTY